MEIINNTLTGNGIVVKNSPNHSGVFAPGKLDTIIIHYTAGSSAESSVKTLMDPNSKASAHLVIGRDGSITQLVPFNVIAWHAGPSQYGTRVGFNQYSIGIEIDNAGVLEKRGGKYFSWFNREYPEIETVQGIHRNQSVSRYWHAFKEEQINIVFDICQLLVRHYNIKFILGHEEISPGRKVDPGPAFPLDKLRERLLGGERDANTPEVVKDSAGIITIDLLNIRQEPSIEAEKVAKPLPKGQKVKILAEKNGWIKVATEVTGWVSGKYVG
jgi:N-acetylmuramoyl-L-alanine amidase